jgi:hypothetical protein
MTNQKRRIEDKLPTEPLKWDEETKASADKQILAIGEKWASRTEGDTLTFKRGYFLDCVQAILEQVPAARQGGITSEENGAGDLTDEQIVEICHKEGLGPCLGLAVGRAIERAAIAAHLARHDAEKANLIEQVRSWHDEAKTQRATVIDILRHFDLPEHDWEAKRLIVDHLARQPKAEQPSGDLLLALQQICMRYAMGSLSGTEAMGQVVQIAHGEVPTHLARQAQAGKPAYGIAPVGITDNLIAGIVDRDTPPDNRDEVVDHDITGKPITRGMVDAFAKAAPVAPASAQNAMPEKAKAVLDIRAAVNRFLGWRLPKDFSPDSGISFTPYEDPLLWPIGTNLFNDDQAKAMFEHCLKDVARPTDDDLWEQTLRDRDTNAEWADKLAAAIAKYFGADIGEHSNMNCPWSEALDAIEFATPAGAQNAGVGAQVVTRHQVICASGDALLAGLKPGDVEYDYALVRNLGIEIGEQSAGAQNAEAIRNAARPQEDK